MAGKALPAGAPLGPARFELIRNPDPEAPAIEFRSTQGSEIGVREAAPTILVM
jgi:hypothetical protein